jgi:hypothetical protein
MLTPMVETTAARHRVTPILAVIAATVGILLGFANPAGAHGDDGAMTITAVEQVGPTSVRVEVGIVFASDDHLATDASASATLTGPGGAPGAPTPLVKQPGNTSLYRADIAVPTPGSWVVAVSSTNPTSRATAPVEVAAQPSTTTGPSPTPTTASAAATAPTAPGTTGAQLSAASAASSTPDSGGSSTTAALIVVAVVAVVVLGAGGVVLARRRSA